MTFPLFRLFLRLLHRKKAPTSRAMPRAPAPAAIPPIAAFERPLEDSAGAVDVSELEFTTAVPVGVVVMVVIDPVGSLEEDGVAVGDAPT